MGRLSTLDTRTERQELLQGGHGLPRWTCKLEEVVEPEALVGLEEVMAQVGLAFSLSIGQVLLLLLLQLLFRVFPLLTQLLITLTRTSMPTTRCQFILTTRHIFVSKFKKNKCNLKLT